MSPETIIDGKINSNSSVKNCLEGKVVNDTEYSMAANGVYFSKKQRGVVPKMVQKMYEERGAHKTENDRSAKAYGKRGEVLRN